MPAGPFGSYVAPQGGGGGGGTIIVNSGALSSGAVTSGYPGNNSINSGSITPNVIGIIHIASGGLGSGAIGSGQVAKLHIVSGGLSSGAVGSGSLAGFELGSGSIVSGRIASGQIGNNHLSADSIWSGHVGSGAVIGSYGSGRNIASGSIGGFDLASGVGTGGGALTSGSVVSGYIGNAAVVSGSYASGSIGSPNHFASGARIDSAEWMADDTYFAQEAISGGKAVAFTQSGTLQVAMAGTSGRMPAVGVVPSNYVSGAAVTMYRDGRAYSTLFNFSGWMNRPLFVGVSGDIVASGAPLASGNIQQIVGVSVSISGMMIQLGDALEPVQIASGDIASGVIQTYDAASGFISRASQYLTPFQSGTAWSLITSEIISGVRAVQVNQSGALRVAMASVSGRMPAQGIVVDNVLSGIAANVYSFGMFQFTSGLSDYSGCLGQSVLVGRSGHVVSISGSFNSGGLSLVSGGDFLQRLGVIVNSGGVVVSIDPTMLQNQAIMSAGYIDSFNRSYGV